MQRNNRRKFLKNSGFLLAGTAVVNNNLFAGSEDGAGKGRRSCSQ